VEALVVHETDRLELVHSQDDLLKLKERNPLRLEIGHRRWLIYVALLLGFGHKMEVYHRQSPASTAPSPTDRPREGLTNEHTLITLIIGNTLIQEV